LGNSETKEKTPPERQKEERSKAGGPYKLPRGKKEEQKIPQKKDKAPCQKQGGGEDHETNRQQVTGQLEGPESRLIKSDEKKKKRRLMNPHGQIGQKKQATNFPPKKETQAAAKSYETPGQKARNGGRSSRTGTMGTKRKKKGPGCPLGPLVRWGKGVTSPPKKEKKEKKSKKAMGGKTDVPAAVTKRQP